jgi:hypothetical protein
MNTSIAINTGIHTGISINTGIITNTYSDTGIEYRYVIQVLIPVSGLI